MSSLSGLINNLPMAVALLVIAFLVTRRQIQVQRLDAGAHRADAEAHKDESTTSRWAALIQAEQSVSESRLADIARLQARVAELEKSERELRAQNALQEKRIQELERTVTNLYVEKIEAGTTTRKEPAS